MIFSKNINTKWLTAALLAGGLSFNAVGCKTAKQEAKKTETATQQQALQEAPAKGLPSGEADSDKLTVGDSYVLGNINAPITIVEFSDFQCPFCSKGANTIHELLKKYPEDIRVVFKHFPLDFHREAPAASAAALAAGEQGKFWEMHDKLFENQGDFKTNAANMKGFVSGLAKELGLDVAKFEADFDKISASDPTKKDQELGRSVGVSGTPAFFINGISLVGAQPAPQFEAVINKELEEIKNLGDKVDKNTLYKSRVEANLKAPSPEDEETEEAQVVEMVPIVDGDPIKGNLKTPLVTVVEFSDFQCPFCSRVNPSLADLMKNFGDNIRVIFKQNPLPFHKDAPAAHKAALAAGKQGKFWEMHDTIFANQDKLSDPANLEKFAKEIGLNVDKFKKDMASEELAKKIEDDLALGGKVGARGTPNFFINGVQLIGAQPYPAFEKLVKEQIEIAKKIAEEKNLSGDALYEEVVKFNKSNVKAPTPKEEAKPAKVDAKLLEQGNAYAKGPADAKVTIVEFSDFECPFCSRGTNTLNEAYKMFDGKVRVIFKNYPLPFHKGAEPAARAALAAGKQGKFWEMHDKLFANQGSLKEDGFFEKTAKELGLNLDKFKKDFDSEELKKQVQDDMKQGSAVGVNGTPAFFINGELVSGAQPLEVFKAAIERNL